MKGTLNVELLMKELNSNDTKLHECLTKESILHEWDESTKQYFPCLIEFSVIAFSLVKHLWPADDTARDDHREGTIHANAINYLPLKHQASLNRVW